MNKLLTISIPTWNRSALIKDLVSQLAQQVVKDKLENDVEILVSNNGSDDDTHEVIEELRSKNPFITYNRNATNIGGNPNLMKSLELANAEFLIFLGDDDRLNNGSLARIVDFLKSNKDIGLVIDNATFKKKQLLKEGENGINDIVKNYYWNMGNAGVFVMRSSFAKESLGKYGYDFFNECWSQTQFMLLGLHNHKNLRAYISNLNIMSHTLHGEMIIYNSYYLWYAGYFELTRAAKSLKDKIEMKTVRAARHYMRKNVLQWTFNILQCGVFIDDKTARLKTKNHIQLHLKEFSFYEQLFLIIMIIALGLPNRLARGLSDLFIYCLKGKKGINKKNEFVNHELLKKEKAKQMDLKTIRETF